MGCVMNEPRLSGSCAGGVDTELETTKITNFPPSSPTTAEAGKETAHVRVVPKQVHGFVSLNGGKLEPTKILALGNSPAELES